MSAYDDFRVRGLLNGALVPKSHFDRAALDSGFHLDDNEDFGHHISYDGDGDRLDYYAYEDGNIVLEQFTGDYENARDFLATLAPHVSMDSSALWVYEDLNFGDTPWVTTIRDGKMYEVKPRFDDLIDAIVNLDNIKPEVVEMPSRDADPLVEVAVEKAVSLKEVVEEARASSEALDNGNSHDDRGRDAR